MFDLNGKVAEALMAKAGQLLAEPPQIDKVDILAVKGVSKEAKGSGA